VAGEELAEAAARRRRRGREEVPEVCAALDPEVLGAGDRRDVASIRLAHEYIGFGAAGAFRGVQTVCDREHLTADEVVVEGRLLGTHVGEFQGFPPSERDVELPFVAFYRFDAGEKLVSERVVMNLGPLAHAPTFGR
jgi:SnoaL-like polyketide cyclase